MKLCQWLNERTHDAPPTWAVLFSIAAPVAFLAALDYAMPGKSLAALAWSYLT